MKGISIIITCYNCGTFILETIESIVNLGIKNEYEIIIIDDFSTDNSYEILKKFENHSNIKIIRNEKNMGPQFSRNIGITKAKYDYIMIMDGDDKLNSGAFIDKAIDVLHNNSEIAFVQGLCKMFGSFEGYTITSYPVTEELAIKKHHVQTSIIHRKIDSPKYNLKIKKWQDWSYGVALLNKRYIQGKENKIYFIEEPYYLYRIHEVTKRISNSNVSEEEMILQTIIENPNIFEKYYGKMDYAKMAKTIYESIPNKMISMLYVANNNLDIALQMCKQRQYDVCSPTEPHNFP